LPFILDENITSIEALLRGHNDGAMDVINLKISKVGGLTKAQQIRDLCVTLNIPLIATSLLEMRQEHQSAFQAIWLRQTPRALA
jgi:hypothetical protein